jgi:hypothetical protein
MKLGEYGKIYAIVTQGFFMMLGLALAGFLIGKFAFKSDITAVILAVSLGIVGLVIFIGLLLKLNLGGDSNKQA